MIEAIHTLPDVGPFALTVDVCPDDFADTMAFLGARHENPCLAVRWLRAANSPDIIQFCELEHHMDGRAHRMPNPDGSVTTWRS